jgi:hypothetical protein
VGQTGLVRRDKAVADAGGALPPTPLVPIVGRGLDLRQKQ